MPLILSPIDALNNLLNIDRKTAMPIVAGMAVIAAATIAATWKVDLVTIGLMGLYIVGLGIVLLIVASAVQDPQLGKVLGWFLTVLIIATISAFFFSAVFRQQGLIKPTYCLTRFWEPCAEVEAVIVNRNSEAIQAAVERPAQVAGPSAESTVNPAGYRVAIYFAGLITRESIVALNQALERAGWPVVGSSGEREETAQGFNEVRYSSMGDRAAAEALAQEVTATGIASGPVEVKQGLGTPAGNLDLWISN